MKSDINYSQGNFHEVFLIRKMREIDTEAPVVWPAWCYSGKRFFYFMGRILVLHAKI